MEANISFSRLKSSNGHCPAIFSMHVKKKSFVRLSAQTIWDDVSEADVSAPSTQPYRAHYHAHVER